MKSTNRKRALLVSSAIILLCMTIIVGVTFALFTDTQTVKNHLQAGDLAITLKRTELVKTTLNEKGYLVTSDPDKTIVNFSNPTDENVFNIETDENNEITEKIVPGSKFVATMQIENHSDVAFGYWIEITCGDDVALAKQLKVTVNKGSDESFDVVGNGLVVQGPNGYVGELAIGDTESFVVTVEFLDSFDDKNGLAYYENDAAQGQSLTFDLIVHAVQATTP